jgi:hypothetical protein
MFHIPQPCPNYHRRRMAMLPKGKPLFRLLNCPHDHVKTPTEQRHRWVDQTRGHLVKQRTMTFLSGSRT